MRIYIAGPYSSDPEGNTRKAIAVAHELRNIGHTPFVPHLTHLWHQQHPREYEDWMAYDYVWQCQCQALLRLPGESPGADLEESQARDLKQTIYHYPDDMHFIEALPKENH